MYIRKKYFCFIRSNTVKRGQLKKSFLGSYFKNTTPKINFPLGEKMTFVAMRQNISKKYA